MLGDSAEAMAQRARRLRSCDSAVPLRGLRAAPRHVFA